MVPPSMDSPQYQQQPPKQAQAAALPTSHAHTKLEGGGRVLCIGGLKNWVNEEYLFGCFDTDGELDTVKVVHNPGLPIISKGYGFIMFTSHAAAQRNLQTKNGSPMPKSKQPFCLSWASREHEDALEYTIFVGNLVADVTDSMLLEAFRPSYPSTKSAKVVKDRVTGRTKRYGFVSFGLKIEQIDAQIDMNGRYCSTRPM